MCLLSAQAGEKGWKAHSASPEGSYGLLRKHALVFCTVRICEFFHMDEIGPCTREPAWSRLYCCPGVLPGKWSLKSVPHLSPESTTFGVLKNYLCLLKYLLPLFCQDLGYDPLSKSALRTCLSSRIYSTRISYQSSWGATVELEGCIS